VSGALLIRGQIVTMDESRRVISDGAVVSVEGRIDFVGDAADAVNRHTRQRPSSEDRPQS
jgi:cytosine/adenosine deaminase-related metal-dependent hydrolase